MNNIKYSNAAVEVLEILNYTSKKDVQKIPQSFMNFLMDIANKNYKVKFDYSKPIISFNLSEETKELLGFIYVTWWSSSEEREKYKKLLLEINKKK